MADKTDVAAKASDARILRKAPDARARNAAVREVHADFARALPNEARRHGAFVVPPDHVNAGQAAVPDGVYRVLGADWLHTFKAGCWISADRVAPQATPDWIEVPDNAAADPAASAGDRHG